MQKQNLSKSTYNRKVLLAKARKLEYEYKQDLLQSKRHVFVEKKQHNSNNHTRKK